MPESSTPRIYLDNAATSWPKPAAVYDAVDDYNRNLGVAVGRGAYRQAGEVQGIVDRCRKHAADLLGAESWDRIVFTFNGTDSLNLALHGLVNAGDHVVTSDIEHNSVLRPLRELSRRLGVETTFVSADRTGLIDPTTVRDALRPNTKLVAITHASNVTGTIQPIAEIAAIAREAGVLCLVDAAQSAGHLPIDLKNLPVDLLACPGHKGLLGPLGTGLLYVRPGVEQQLQSVRQGGTGSNSEDDRQPDLLPDKYESGNHNAPGLCGLEAALAWIQERGVESIRAHERELTSRLLDGLARIEQLTIHGPCDAEKQVGVVSVTIPGFEPQVLASILDESFGIQTRAGLHCAPGAHRALRTFEAGGTVRLSVGPFTTANEIDAAVTGLAELAGAV
ncbi:MAG: aminotransferase class V-fold PLP-dependent enzyme [Planctomycetaceae bacterium]|jgi:cysteine desulfurase / selenocysteine lyase|nr:aminotransferase class V-fold PLP-dependent enzyme [Planctomycetaceae bacterium]MBT6157056.1 aminotransferase class V-fold PLP-dependent enzyme [Planctomycetaceae bacterium]MBT6484378.1 aminotransferase class V-fold PLP-dependent enzyme [Planctomycetaceae bacterium]MBT6498021.1 aminotransferase class V-fold PLP-dependent enzyme [Planctomycetaceae bacterium]